VPLLQGKIKRYYRSLQNIVKLGQLYALSTQTRAIIRLVEEYGLSLRNAQ